MGNAITLNAGGTQNSSGIINDKTDLGKFVNDWALNSYDIHPDAKNLKLLNNSLKKRACCTNQQTIPIGILGVTSINGKLQLANHKVNIKVFDSKASITDENCTLDDFDGTSSFKYTGDVGGKPYASSQQCKTFYATFGNLIKKNRGIHKDINERLYGINIDEREAGSIKDSSGNITHISNQFIDFNCINGLYMNPEYAIGDSTSNDPNWAEQVSDLRCSLNADKTFKPYIKDDGMLCFNIINADVIEATNNGTIQINQACRQQQDKTFEIDVKAPPTANTSTPPAINTPTPPAINTPTPPAINTQAVTQSKAALQAATQSRAALQAATQSQLRAAQTAIASKQNTIAPTSPSLSPTMKLYAMGGSIVCSICCCLLILILVYLSMSKKK